MSFLSPRPDFPVKPAHLALWAGLKMGVWAMVSGLWLLHGHFPWRTAAAGEFIVYLPIPIYFGWVAWTLFMQRRSQRSVERRTAAVRA